MKLQIVPDININNTKVLGMLENMHYYRPLLKRIRKFVKNGSVYYENEPQYTTVYEILMSKDNISFVIGFDDRLKDNVQTELKICWPGATYKETKESKVFSHTKELELAEHYFLSLHTDFRTEAPLSHILETQNLLRSEEQILIRMELQPVSETWYRELEECIKNFDKGKVTTKSLFSKKDLGFKAGEAILDITYGAIDIINDMISDEKIEHDRVTDSKYSKLLRHGLSENTKEKGRYNGYRTRFIISTNSDRQDLIFKNLEKAFNTMAGDNKFILVDQSKYKNVLGSKEIAQILQLPTKYYQQLYRINNIDTREVEIPKELLGGQIPIGTAQKHGVMLNTYWSTDSNIRALPKIIVGPQNAGKTSLAVNFTIGTHKVGDSNIVIDYVQDCEFSKAIEKHIPKHDLVIINVHDENNIFAMAYTEAAKQITADSSAWHRLKIANLVASQVEYLINSVSDSTAELSPPMLRFLYAACMVVFIQPGRTIDDVFKVLRKWEVRNEYIRQAKYTKCFEEDDEIFDDLEQLHDRDGKGKIIGTRESLIQGIVNRMAVLNKNIYVKSMLKAKTNNDIDFINYIDQGKTVLIRIPQTTFVDPQIRDCLATYFMSRIWLAVQLRSQANNRLCHVIADEVHQIPTCASFIKNHITEFRRHRLGTYFTVHYLKQFNTLLQAIKSAGASYQLLCGTEKDNLKALEEELQPFTIQEGLELKPFTSLNIINYGNQYAKYISKLPAPA